MGCSISCAASECFNSFLEWALRQRAGLTHVIHYVDDFLFSGKPGSEQCVFLMRTFQTLTRELGIPLADEKTEGPSMVITFFGDRARYSAAIQQVA